MAWHGMARQHAAWHGMRQHGMEWHEAAWHGLNLARHGKAPGPASAPERGMELMPHHQHEAPHASANCMNTPNQSRGAHLLPHPPQILQPLLHQGSARVQVQPKSHRGSVPWKGCRLRQGGPGSFVALKARSLVHGSHDMTAGCWALHGTSAAPSLAATLPAGLPGPAPGARHMCCRPKWS